MFYDNFLKQCKLKGVSPTTVSAEIGLSRATATGWKNGKQPSYPTLKLLADYFGCTAEDLMPTPTTEAEQEDASDIGILLERNKDLRNLFDIAKDCSPATLKRATKIIEALKNE